jgi:hypothetical protein
MDFFQLKQGKLILQTPTIDLTETVTQGRKVFVKFPWAASSMRKIEDCVKKRPLFNCLSFMPLPETDRPLADRMSKSTLNGWIEKEYWETIESQPNHWLATKEIQLLSAIFLRNRTEQNAVHVIPPDITLRMKHFYDVTLRIAKKKRNQKINSYTVAMYNTLQSMSIPSVIYLSTSFLCFYATKTKCIGSQLWW